MSVCFHHKKHAVDGFFDYYFFFRMKFLFFPSYYRLWGYWNNIALPSKSIDRHINTHIPVNGCSYRGELLTSQNFIWLFFVVASFIILCRKRPPNRFEFLIIMRKPSRPKEKKRKINWWIKLNYINNGTSFQFNLRKQFDFIFFPFTMFELKCSFCLSTISETKELNKQKKNEFFVVSYFVVSAP